MKMRRFLAAPGTLLLAALASCNRAPKPPPAAASPPTLFRVPGEQAAQLQFVTVQTEPVRRPIHTPFWSKLPR